MDHLKGSMASEPQPPGPDTAAPPPTRNGPAGALGPFTRRHLVVVAGIALVAMVLLAIVTTPVATGPATGAPGRAAPAQGANFYGLGGSGVGLEIGDRPPSLREADGSPLFDLDSQAVDLAGYQGQPVWIVFWATWCPPCQRETPDLRRAWEANRADGLQILAVDVQEGADIARDYATTYRLTYPIVLDSKAAAFGDYGVFGLPTHYFIGRDGLIKDRWFGPLSFDEMQRRIDSISVASP